MQKLGLREHVAAPIHMWEKSGGSRGFWGGSERLRKPGGTRETKGGKKTYRAYGKD